MAEDTARRFIEAFNDIENHLRGASGDDESVPFAKLVHEYTAARHLPRQSHDALLAFARLRNAISHERYLGGRPIAEPRPDVVGQIERLRDLIIAPPKVLSVVPTARVAVTAPDEPVSTGLVVMRRYDYSQLPVYDAGRYAGILTTNAIARWLAHTLTGSDGLAEAEPVRTVMEFAEPHERALHVPRTITAAEALRKLASGGESGRPVAALIVTHSGKPTETALGIVVDDDIPAILAALTVT